MEVHVGETFRKRLIVYYMPLFLSLVPLLFPLHISGLDLLWDYDLYHLMLSLSALLLMAYFKTIVCFF
jgi:hypothetical protein